jgi:hypothetical protein
LAGVFIEILAGVERSIGLLWVEALELGGFFRGGRLSKADGAENGT